MSGMARWLTAGVLAVLCAVAGVFVASVLQPRVVAEPQTTPVTVHVTTTATADPRGCIGASARWKPSRSP